MSIRHFTPVGGYTWKPAENLGPVINSAYDETSPFLARNGRTLYFSSSDATRSMGGLDVLRATWLGWSERWSPPVNLGPPINSASDDEHFTLSHGGDRGFFDSDRISGEGGRDLFVALFDEPREGQLSESWPVAFCLVAEGEKSPAPSELAVQPPGSFFDEITSFELPVMTLPPPGGTPNEQTVNQFALLAQLLKKYPRLRATLALHSAVGDVPVGYAVFASQTVTDLLRQEGVGMERVTLLFAGSSFPLADNPSTGVNRRAEVFIENPTELPFELYRPALPPNAFRAGFFQKAMASLAYYVTVDGGRWTVDGELAKLFELYPDGLEGWLSQSGGMFFTPGIYLTHASAAEWLQSLQADGYKSAKITAHLRGRELSKEEAAKYVGDFPDLLNFIEN
ncbi:MAG: PD40 domain-containing protein [Saprospiraceae bacterium]|nr:PD40 domain-containing protein [Saprospiraceae bacterium]